ncbi:hypothetical protein A0M43_05245 [Campylobacter jejuni]|uniref:hypothetical protein n=1 Tax=Campylobacter TaxID=194 RepID=UPI0001C27EDF|nr:MULTISPECIES: hypothetical protein [Campylobacter]EFC30203.1 hypothetical protein C1336_000780027 [Campylobacter jejuni subsp. jejuni 1336]OEW46432.1 hypothetical protein AJ888_04850 [Campylobacter sp. BCW_6467]OEX02051.1 hypothetical protein A0M43_05245 [Campylobacter jejuni]OEX15113.1 hypothetical protein A0M51_04130 [Campylobacter jejuni]OEX20124.1 hypothetical protein A0M52_01685 [Campylobacter jejuni]
MKNYYISEGVKALFSIYFKDQTEENFIKALNEFAKESQINSQEIKDKSFREFKEAISKLPTIDLLNTRFDKLEYSIGAKLDKPEDSVCAKLNKLENKLDSFKREVRTYVIILAALMFILQPTIFDLILSIFKSFLRQ